MGETVENPERGVRIVDVWARRQLDAVEARARRVKRWRFEVRDPRSQRYERQTFDDRTDGWAWVRRRRALFELGLGTARKVRLAELAEEYCRELTLAGRSAAHVREHELVFARLEAAGAVDVLRPDWPGAVVATIAAMRAQRPGVVDPAPIAPATRNGYLGHVRALCRWAVGRRMLPHDPMAGVRPFTVDRASRPTFRLEELVRLVSDDARWSPMRPRRAAELALARYGSRASAAEALGCTAQTLANRLREEEREHPYWLPMCLLIYTGCRIEEALHLEWTDLDWQAERVAVRIKPVYRLKGRRERLTVFPAELRAILEPRRRDRGYLVSDEATRTGEQRSRFRSYLRAAGVERGRRTIHSLRHSHAALRIAAGDDGMLVRSHMGHESIATTQQYVSGPAVDGYRQAVRDWPGRGEFWLRRPLG